MDQLPPKIPNMTANWPEFSHQKIPTMVAGGGFTPNATVLPHPLWVDDFLDFSSTKRGSHRRSVSDSIAFLEMPMLDECRGSTTNQHAEPNTEFDRFDDEQFISMFTDVISSAVGPSVSYSNPSTPSDHNSIDDEKEALRSNDRKQQQNESEEVQSHSSGNDGDAAGDPITDPKRVKRILANRKSAQRSRVRKLQYVSQLERSVNSLHAEVSVLSPRVAFLDHQRLVLNIDNSALKQRIAALAQDKIFKDAHQEALKREIERLRQVYQQQNLRKMENIEHSPPSSNSNSAADIKENLLNV